MALLDLNTKEKGDHVVNIDDKPYTLTPWSAFSYQQIYRIKRIGSLIQDLFKKDDPTDEDIQQIGELYDEQFELVKGNIPATVAKKLSPGLKQKIADAYFLAELASRNLPKEASSENGQEQQSPGSNDSTEEAPENG